MTPIRKGALLARVLALLCLLMPGALRAGEPASPSAEAWSPLDTLFTLPPVEVHGRRVRRHELRERRSLARDVIRPADHPRRLAGLDELLQELPGLELRRLGGLGAFSTASLRGSGGREVAVFLDGVDLRSPFTGLALLDELPLAGVSRVEVFRGGVPGELGGGAPAGAIHVLTGGEDGGRLALGAGSYGTRRGSASLRGPAPWGLRWSLDAGAVASDADFLYLDRNGTTLSNSADDTLRVRRNADFAGTDLMLRLGGEDIAHRLPGRWEAFYRYLRRENGIPGSESLPTESTRSLRSGHDGRLRWESPLLPGRLRLGAVAYARLGWTRFLNPAGESGPFLVTDETRDRLATRGLQARADLYLLPLHLLLRGERRSDEFLPENLNPRKGKGYQRRREGERLEGEARLLVAGDRLLVVAAYGEEWLVDNYFGPPPLPWLPAQPQPQHGTHAVFRRAGLRARLLDRAGGAGRLSLELFANAGDGYRPPSLLELFGQDVSVSGNPELLPERGRQGDLGLSLDGSRGGARLRLGLSVFRRRLTEQILFLRNSQYSVRAENLAASEVEGLELNARIENRGTWLRVAATRQWARDRSGVAIYDGKELPYRSPLRLFARLGLRRGPHSAYVDMDRRSAVFTDRYNDPDRKLPSATLWGAGLRLRVRASVSLALAGLNLTGERVEDYLGYPLPGRSWRFGVEWESDAAGEEAGP